MDRPDAKTVRCPTCRASQEWSDTCRRCKSDLRLLRDVAQAYRRSRRDSLLALEAGRPRAALLAAQRSYELSNDDESRRLLALAAFLAGDWATATDMAQSLVDRPSSQA